MTPIHYLLSLSLSLSITSLLTPTTKARGIYARSIWCDHAVSTASDVSCVRF